MKPSNENNSRNEAVRPWLHATSLLNTLPLLKHRFGFNISNYLNESTNHPKVKLLWLKVGLSVQIFTESPSILAKRKKDVCFIYFFKRTAKTSVRKPKRSAEKPNINQLGLNELVQNIYAIICVLEKNWQGNKVQKSQTFKNVTLNLTEFVSQEIVNFTKIKDKAI